MPKDKPFGAKSQAGAPGTDILIEVTPEMIEAGLDELWFHDITEPREEEMRDAVRAIYVAMNIARV